MINGTSLESSPVNGSASFILGLGRLVLEDIRLAHNETIVQCRATLDTGVVQDSITATFLVQGQQQRCMIFFYIYGHKCRSSASSYFSTHNHDK